MFSNPGSKLDSSGNTGGGMGGRRGKEEKNNKLKA